MKKDSFLSPLLFLSFLVLFFFLVGCTSSSTTGQAYQGSTKSTLKVVPFCPSNACAWGKTMFYKENGKLGSFEKKDIFFECREPKEDATCFPEGTILYANLFNGLQERSLVCTKGFWEFTNETVPLCSFESAKVNE